MEKITRKQFTEGFKIGKTFRLYGGGNMEIFTDEYLQEKFSSGIIYDLLVVRPIPNIVSRTVKSNHLIHNYSNGDNNVYFYFKTGEKYYKYSHYLCDLYMSIDGNNNGCIFAVLND